MKRRGFLSLLGVTPFGLKAAAEDSLVQMGFTHGSKVLAAAAPIANDTHGEPHSVYCPNMSSHHEWLTDQAKKLSRFLMKKGIPEWKLAELQERAWFNPPPGIDPDLAVLVSMSAGRKAIIQRHRNFERIKSMSVNRRLRDMARAKFAEKIGVDWYD